MYSYKIYKIIDKRDSCVIYVGVTRRTLQIRFSEHKSYKELLTYKYMECHGFDNFDIQLIEECHENGFEREIYWIKYYLERYPLLNRFIGGKKDYGHISFDSLKQYVILLNTEEIYEITEASKIFHIDEKTIFEVCNKERKHEHYRIWRYQGYEITGNEFDFLKGMFYSPDTGKVKKRKDMFPEGCIIKEANKFSVLEKIYYVYSIGDFLTITGQKNESAIKTRMSNFGYKGNLKLIKQFYSYDEALIYKNKNQTKHLCKKITKNANDYDYYVYEIYYQDKPIYIGVSKTKDICPPVKVKKFMSVLDCEVRFIEKVKHKKNALLKVKERLDSYEKINLIEGKACKRVYNLYNDKKGSRNLNELLSLYVLYKVVLIKDKNNKVVYVLACQESNIEHQYHTICTAKHFKNVHYEIACECKKSDIKKIKEKFL